MALSPTSSRGGGSSTGPSVVLQVTVPPDIRTVGHHRCNWNKAFNNQYDYTQILALPSGLGLSFAIDGSDGTMTATEEGYWWMELGFALPVDATVAGFCGLQSGAIGQRALGPGVVLGAGEPEYEHQWGAVVHMPAAATDYFDLRVFTAATTNPYNPTFILGQITRLG